MSISVNGQSVVPPGFRFHPTEEELLTYYLAKKVASRRIDLDVIPDVDLNKLEPWDIQERCRIGTGPQSDWYLFSHKDKKYPTGTRTNRATAAGFWKATGRDKPIYSSSSSSSSTSKIGMRKTLVFYKGRAPHGTKSDWIMHEYRLHDDQTQLSPGASSSPIRGVDQQQEEGWVICRVFKKKNLICNNNNNNNQALVTQMVVTTTTNNNNNKQPAPVSPSRSCSAVSDDRHVSRAAQTMLHHHYAAAGSGDADTLDHILRYMGKQESKPLTSACSLPAMDVLQYNSLANGGGTLYDKFMKLPPLEHVVVSGSGAGGGALLPPPAQYSGDCWADTLAAYELNNGGLSDDGSTKTANGGGMSTAPCFFVDEHQQHGHGGGDGDLWSLARSVSTLHADLTTMNNV